MQVSVSDAKGQLTELVRRAEAGDEVILTRHGHAAVRLVPVRAVNTSASRAATLRVVRAAVAGKASAGPSAARSQDFLYGDDGLPGVIAVDTSALMAILLDEPQADACSDVLKAEETAVISAGTVAEALIVAARRDVGQEMERLLDELGLEIVGLSPASARRVAQAYGRWGKGIHPAALNFGDCFAYTLAIEHGCSLLYVGKDFGKTDVESAIR